jgi:alkylhydroperoxidase family enzyme
VSRRYRTPDRALFEAVTTAPGATASELRRAIEAYAARLGGRRTDAAAPAPPIVAAFVEKVARHAYNVTDDDVDALKRAGYSDDAIFEIIVSAAVGAGRARLERGLAALNGES